MRPNRWGRRGTVISTIVGLAIPLIVFGVVFPQAMSYDQAIRQIQSFTSGWLMALLLAAVLNVMLYPFPALVAVRNLTYGRGFVVRQAGFLVSNLTPVGGPLAVGTQYAILARYRVRRSEAAAAVAADAAWALLLTLGLPAVAVIALAMSGEPGTAYGWLAVVGVVVVVLSIVALAVLMRSERWAQAAATFSQRIATGVFHRLGRPAPPVADSLLAFRTDAHVLVGQRWKALTVTNLIAQLTPLLVLVCALAGLGDTDVTVVEALAAYSFAIALNALPLTPGGLGMTDAALVGLLVAYGATPDTAVAADLVWRLAWFLVQMVVGAVALSIHLLARQRHTATRETPTGS